MDIWVEELLGVLCLVFPAVENCMVPFGIWVREAVGDVLWRSSIWILFSRMEIINNKIMVG